MTSRGLAIGRVLASYLARRLPKTRAERPDHMRAEIETMASEIKQSVELLRRHL